MSEFAARIGRIRMKSGGAEFRILNNQKVIDGEEDWRGSVIKAARSLGEHATDEVPLVGYLVIGFYSDGMVATGYRYDDRCPVPKALMPAWLAEIVRRDVLMEGEARFVFNEMFERID